MPLSIPQGCRTRHLRHLRQAQRHGHVSTALFAVVAKRIARLETQGALQPTATHKRPHKPLAPQLTPGGARARRYDRDAKGRVWQIAPAHSHREMQLTHQGRRKAHCRLPWWCGGDDARARCDGPSWLDIPQLGCQGCRVARVVAVCVDATHWQRCRTTRDDSPQ